MNNKNTTNIAFILLICFLFAGALKAQKTPLTPFAGMPNIPSAYSSSEKDSQQVVLRDFDEVSQVKEVDKTIDRATAMSYIQTRQLSGSEMIAMTKIKKINPYLNKDKKIVIYVNEGSDFDVKAFMSEFSKSRTKYSSNPNYVFIPLETLWDLKEENIKNTHDRVVYNLQQDCGLFCIFDLRGEKLIKLKGSQVSKKSAQIVDVILNSL